jgi:hypothetical protein
VAARCATNQAEQRHGDRCRRGGSHADSDGGGGRPHGRAPDGRERLGGGVGGRGRFGVRVVVGTDVIILDKTTQKILDIIRDVAILTRDITK